MIECEWTAKAKCSECEKIVYENDTKSDFTVFCWDCDKKCFDERFREAFKLLPIQCNYLWHPNDKDYFDCTEEEEKLIKIGIQHGFRDALFWMADYFGVVDIYENLVDTKEPLSLTRGESGTFKKNHERTGE